MHAVNDLLRKAILEAERSHQVQLCFPVMKNEKNKFELSWKKWLIFCVGAHYETNDMKTMNAAR